MDKEKMKPRTVPPLGGTGAWVKNLPDCAGVYLMKDKSGRVIYIGKASSLRKRVSSYFQRNIKSPRLESLVSNIKDIDFIATHSEAEALIYEASLVKSMRPKYNVELRDDKSYPYLKLTNEEYPRLTITRKRESDGSRYFGPYTNVKLLKKAASFIRKIFPLRSCNRFPKKVCLIYHIRECMGPCKNKVSRTKYGSVVKELTLFLEGKRETLIRELAKQMRNASRSLNYEEAAKIRDRINALSVATEGAVKISAFDEAEDLRQFLGIRRRLHRIEAFDVSNISGRDSVGSLVVFINGKPSKSEYRRYRIKTVDGINDYAMIKEIVRRRYIRVLDEHLPLPDLIVVDGGRGHLSTAIEALAELGLKNKPVIGIAKEFERIWLPGKDIPLMLHKNSPILHLLQRIRDEAHRFAHSYYNILRKRELIG